MDRKIFAALDMNTRSHGVIKGGRYTGAAGQEDGAQQCTQGEGVRDRSYPVRRGLANGRVRGHQTRWL